MAGGLAAFLIAILVICILVAMLYVALPKISPDPSFTQIGQLAIGGIAVILVIELALAALGMGGGAAGASLDAGGLIKFAIALIIIMIVIFVLYMAVDALLPQFAMPIKYVVGGIALIAILLAANFVLFGGAIPNWGGGAPLGKRGELLLPFSA